MAHVKLDDVTKTFGGTCALKSVTLEIENGQPMIPPGYAADLRRALTDIAGRTNARLRFIGYTKDERLDRRTASVYGDDIGLSAARARRAMDIVMKDPAREVQCHLMIGLCFLEEGMQTDAIGQFKKGLYVEGITEREALSMYFELGQAYEQLGDRTKAVKFYKHVVSYDRHPLASDAYDALHRLQAQ